MLKKSLRLKTNDFRDITTSKKLYTKHFTFRYIENTEKTFKNNTFSVIAPKKLYKKANKRNSAKRFIYSYLNNLIDTRGKKPKKIFIFINKDIFSSPKEDIFKEIDEIRGV